MTDGNTVEQSAPIDSYFIRSTYFAAALSLDDSE